MRQLQNTDDESLARDLSDALEVAGIENQVRSEAGSHAVWVIDEADLEAAARIAQAFEGSQAAATRAEADRIRKRREADARPVRLPGLGGRGLMRGGTPGPFTLALIALSVVVGVLTGLGGDLQSPVLRALLVVPVSPEGYYMRFVDWSEPWRLLTPMLIHFGLLHLIFNMLWLFRLGSQIERLQGTGALLFLVVATQVPGALVQFETHGPLFGGMSGVVYGLFGYTWVKARYGSEGYALSDQDTLWIMGWFALCATGFVGRIANAQHALGLIAGLLAAMPAYVAFRRSSATLEFAEGSWADLNIRGFQRFRRRWFAPYVPFWFVALAAFVLWID